MTARPPRARLPPWRGLRLRSISTRLALWYACAATATLAVLFATGYFLLERHVVSGLDLLVTSELGEVRAHMVREYDPNDATFLERRLRKPTDRSSALFYIDVRNEQNGLRFRSTNLNGQDLDGPPGAHKFDLHRAGLPPLRVGSYRIAPYTINVGTLDRGVGEMLEGYVEIGMWLSAVMLAASLAIGLVLSRLALRPVRRISDTAARIHSDNLSERIPVGKVSDELSDLSVMLNEMFDRLESSFRQVRQFSAEASHELKTPLSLVRLYAEKMLLSGSAGAAHEETLQLQLEELARLDQIIDELLFLSRVEANAITLNLEQVNPAPFLQHFAQDAGVLAEHYGLRFAHMHDGDGRVAFDAKRLRQVLLNLVSNALKVTPAGGNITLRSVLEDGVWCMSIEDEGTGLPVEQHERIFERFVRFQPAGCDSHGSGLGLAICRSIVAMHGGRIHAANNPAGAGLRVVIEIPA